MSGPKPNFLQIGARFVNPDAIDEISWPDDETGKGKIYLRSGKEIIVPKEHWPAVSKYFSEASDSIY